MLFLYVNHRKWAIFHLCVIVGLLYFVYNTGLMLDTLFIQCMIAGDYDTDTEYGDGGSAYTMSSPGQQDHRDRRYVQIGK